MAESNTPDIAAATLAALPHPLAAFDHNGKLTFVNAAAEQALERSAKELAGLDIRDVFPALSAAPMEAALRRVSETGRAETLAIEHGGRSLELRVFASANGGIAATLADLTDRRRQDRARHDADEQTQQRLAELEAIYRAGPVALLCVDRDLRFTRINQCVVEMTGLSVQEAVGHTIFEMIPDIAPMVENHYRAVLASGEPRLNVHVRTPTRIDPAVHEFRASYFPIKDLEGLTVGVSAVIQDITEQANQQRLIRFSEERYRRIVETAAEGIWIVDQAGLTTFVNEPMARILGYTPEEMMGRIYLDFVDPADLERAALGFANRKQGGRGQRDYRYRRKNGTQVWCSVSVSLIESDEGVFMGVLGMFTDITDRKLADLALQENEAHLRLALEAGRMGTWLWLCATNELIWSEGHYRLFGLDPYSKTPTCDLWLAGIHPEDRERVDAAAQKALQNLLPLIDEYRVIWPDGSIHWIESRSQWWLDAEGKPLQVRGIIMDVTARKDLEQETLQRQKLEGLGLLAGGIAHDFNNLLAGILGGATFAQDLLPPAHQVAPMLDIVVRSSERAAHLTRQLLAYAGKGTFVIQPIDIDALFTETLDLIQSTISSRVTVTQSRAAGSADGMLIVEGDYTQLQQLVMNLVLNANEAAPPDQDGWIRIETGAGFYDRAALDAVAPSFNLEPGNFILMRIADNGSGMSPETLARIFDPFFTTKFTGRGLGLSAAHGIVTSHGGAILVESEKGAGTTFRVLLPQSERQSLPAVVKTFDQSVCASGTVLILDDEDVVRITAKSALEYAGMTVLAAATTEAALRLLETEHGVSVVLLDMSMPDMNGVEALKRLRAAGLTAPVLISSGFGEVEVIRRFEGLGIAGVIEKPFRAKRLVEAITAILREEKS